MQLAKHPQIMQSTLPLSADQVKRLLKTILSGICTWYWSWSNILRLHSICPPQRPIVSELSTSSDDNLETVTHIFRNS